MTKAERPTKNPPIMTLEERLILLEGNKYKEEQITDLMDNLELTIICDNCRKSDNGAWGIGDIEYAEMIYNEGWRVDTGKTLCPKCVAELKKKGK